MTDISRHCESALGGRSNPYKGDDRAKRIMDDNFFMKEALREAQKALHKDEVPIGAVAVYKSQIIGRGHNQIEQLQDPTAHAEILAVTAAANALSSWRLNDVEMYVTVEPCIMCAGAMVQARIKRVIFGARDAKFGGCGSIFNVVGEKRLNHRVQITAGVMEKEAASLMKSFFQRKRKKAKSN
jgi:tRNA(adenine34) deaminase